MAVHRHGAKVVSLSQDQSAEFRLADARGILQHCLEHRLELARRAGDDPEHLRGRGLLLQLESRAQLVEQARVLDGDYGLVGESFDQLDLLAGERPPTSLRTTVNDAHQISFAHEGYAKPVPARR